MNQSYNRRSVAGFFLFVWAVCVLLALSRGTWSKPAPVGSQAAASRSVPSTRNPNEQPTAARSPHASAERSRDDDWVVDWDFTSNEKPKIVWSKAEAGYQVTLDEAGQVIVVGDAVQGRSLDEASRDPIRQRLHEEAHAVMRARLPMKPRAAWEREQRSREQAGRSSSEIKPVDLEAKGYSSQAELIAAYRTQYAIADDQQVEVFMRKNEQGQWEERMRVTSTSPGEF